MEKEVLKLEKSEAIKVYPSAPEWFKKVLIGTFGENCFGGKIIDRIFTVQDALNERGKKLEDICRMDDRADKKARDIMEYVIEVVNEDFKADYDNGDQKKWSPIFQKTPTGFRFHGSGYDSTDAASSVGSRFCYASEEKCDHICSQPEFLALYNDILTK